jgi:hypothetical protein
MFFPPPPVVGLEWSKQQHHSNELWNLDSTFLVFLQLFLPESRKNQLQIDC